MSFNARWRGEFLALGGVLALGFAFRAWLLPFPPLKDDMEILIQWGRTIGTVPWGDFYSHADPDCDYPAVCLYILWGSVKLRQLILGPAADPAGLANWLKLAPMAADIALGATAYLICRRFLSVRRSVIACALVLFSPGILLVSAVWGQVDSIPNAFALASLLALISGRPNVAALLAGLGLLVKPQYLLFLLGPAVAYLRSETLRLPPLSSHGSRGVWARWLSWRVIVPVLVLLATVQAAMLPFSVSLWPMGEVEWTFWDRLALRGGKFALTSVGAFNLWATPIAGTWIPDSRLGWLSMSYQAWGMVLTALAMIPALFIAWRRPNDPFAVLWSCFLIYLSFFELSTRIHERYLFTAIPLVAAASVFRPWAFPYYLATSGLYILNTWIVYNTQPSGAGRLEASPYAGIVLLASVFSVVLLAAVLAAVPVIVSQRRNWKDGRGRMWGANPDGSAPGQATPGLLSAIISGLSRPRQDRAARVFVATIALLSLLGAGFLAGMAVGARDNGVYTAMVRAYKPWQETGVQVVEGQRLLFSATGDWTNRRGGERFGPGGGWRVVDGTVMPEVRVGALLGRIGDSAPFVIGDGSIITGPETGPLKLVMNDWLDDRSDAQGSARVRITVLTP